MADSLVQAQSAAMTRGPSLEAPRSLAVTHSPRGFRVVCLGVCPSKTVFNRERSNEFCGGLAGCPVLMAQYRDVTYGLTNRFSHLRPADEMIELLL